MFLGWVPGRALGRGVVKMCLGNLERQKYRDVLGVYLGIWWVFCSGHMHRKPLQIRIRIAKQVLNLIPKEKEIILLLILKRKNCEKLKDFSFLALIFILFLHVLLIKGKMINFQTIKQKHIILHHLLWFKSLKFFFYFKLVYKFLFNLFQNLIDVF